MTSTDDIALPRVLRLFLLFLQSAPMTELKTFSGLVLLFATAGWLAVSVLFRLEIRMDVLDSWLLFLSGLLTISAFGQGWKQTTAAKVTVAAQKAAS